MTVLNNRNLNLVIFLGCIGLLITAIFIEPFKSMNPCPMCMMQRAIFAAIALTCLISFIHNSQGIGARIYGGISGIIAITGIAVAGRQIWLQNLPEDQVPACGPGLEYMLDVFPILEVIQMSLLGTGDCAEVQWQFLGLTIPGWSLLAFIGILLISLFIMMRKAPSSS